MGAGGRKYGAGQGSPLPQGPALLIWDLWGEQWGGATSQRNESGGSDGLCAPGSVFEKAVFINRW